jgi:uncharacterized protein YutE (UPF0331/DUF86 family)
MTPGLISEKVITVKLSLLSDMFEKIQTLPLASEEAFLADPLMVAAGESLLRRALEALLDVGRHILAKGFGEVVAEYARLGSALAEHGVVDRDTAELMRRMGGYRNRLVHGYEEVTGPELHRILTIHLHDVAGAAEVIRAWLANNAERLDRQL